MWCREAESDVVCVEIFQLSITLRGYAVQRLGLIDSTGRGPPD
jgi:hypothetical protein